MNKDKLYWTLQIGGWTIYTCIQLLFRYSYASLDNVQTLFLVIEALLFFSLTHQFRLLMRRLGWLEELSLRKVIPRVLGSALSLGLIIYLLRICVSIPLGLFNESVVFNVANIIGLSVIFSLIFFIWLVLYFTYHYFVQYNTGLKHEAAIKDIQLTNLKSQLNPHFIFNALNSVRALVDEDPAKAKTAITQLSGILRNSLITDTQKLTAFEDELNTVKDYLALEKIRYEERLTIQYDIHPESRDFLIPPLMLQTLVENAIKHGISKYKNGGGLSIKTNMLKNSLIIEIRNTGVFNNMVSEKKNTTGNGLKNTRKRLGIIFGDKASFQIRNEKEKTVLTTLTIPETR